VLVLLRSFTNSFGKVFGVSIVGEGSGEMINEWALIIQKKIRLHSIFVFSAFISYYGVLKQTYCGNVDDEKNE